MDVDTITTVQSKGQQNDSPDTNMTFVKLVISSFWKHSERGTIVALEAIVFGLTVVEVLLCPLNAFCKFSICFLVEELAKLKCSTGKSIKKEFNGVLFLNEIEMYLMNAPHIFLYFD